MSQSDRPGTTVYDPADDADKMRALVRLAASIAAQLDRVAIGLESEIHTLTNPLSSQSDPHAIALINKGIRQISTIAELLSKFSGQETIRTHITTVTASMSKLEPMLRQMADDSIDLIVECSPSLANRKLDNVKLQRIVLSLVARALNAMPEGGTLTIKIAGSLCSQLADGQSPIQIVISDTGFPIPRLSQIFEPMLSLKSPSLWLGLSTIYGTVHGMGGSIVVKSNSSGSIFTIQIPAAP